MAVQVVALQEMVLLAAEAVEVEQVNGTLLDSLQTWLIQLLSVPEAPHLLTAERQE